jgi:hypothetical protein
MVLFQYMNNVEFDEEQYSQNSFGTKKPSRMAAIAISTGLVKDEKGANVVMIGLIFVLLIIAVVAITGNSNDSSDAYDPARDNPSLYL